MKAQKHGRKVSFDEVSNYQRADCKAAKSCSLGPEGIGKTTFAAVFRIRCLSIPKAVRMSMMLPDYRRRLLGRCCWMRLERLSKIQPAVKHWLLIRLNWAEQLCVGHVCAKNGKNGIEDFGLWQWLYFCNGNEFGRFLNLLSDVIEVGINVVLTAHMQMRKFELPNEGGSFDRYELKLGKKTSSQTAPLVKEWADMLLFANYKTIVIAQDKDGKKCRPPVVSG